METNEKTIWVNLPEDEKLTILSNIAEEKGIKACDEHRDFPDTAMKPCHILHGRKSIVGIGLQGIRKTTHCRGVPYQSR